MAHRSSPRDSLFPPTHVSFPRLVQFFNTTENLRFESFDGAKFKFSRDKACAKVYPQKVEIYFSMVVRRWLLDWQVSSVAQIFTLSQIFSTME